MSERQPKLKNLSRMPPTDRRAVQGIRAQLIRYLGIILSRPVALSWVGWRPRVGFVDRRTTSDVFPVYAELSARLTAYRKVNSTRRLRELRIVHKALGIAGWLAVDKLPCQLLAKAAEQVFPLRGKRSSFFLEVFILRLREHCLSAARREERELLALNSTGLKGVIVSDGSYDEFEAMNRQWKSVGLEPPSGVGAWRQDPTGAMSASKSSDRHAP